MESISIKTNFLPSYNFNKFANLKYLYHFYIDDYINNYKMAQNYFRNYDTLIINNDTINVLKKYKDNRIAPMK